MMDPSHIIGLRFIPFTLINRMPQQCPRLEYVGSIAVVSYGVAQFELLFLHQVSLFVETRR